MYELNKVCILRSVSNNAPLFIMIYQSILTTSFFNDSDLQFDLFRLNIETDKLNRDIEEYIYTGSKVNLVELLMNFWGMDRDVAEFQLTKL